MSHTNEVGTRCLQFLDTRKYTFALCTGQDRAIQSSAEWRRSMAEVDAAVFKHLREGIKGGFDEERFASRIGFSNLKRYV